MEKTSILLWVPCHMAGTGIEQRGQLVPGTTSLCPTNNPLTYPLQGLGVTGAVCCSFFVPIPLGLVVAGEVSLYHMCPLFFEGTSENGRDIARRPA